MAVCMQITYCIQFGSGTTADRKITLYNDRLQIFLKRTVRQNLCA